MHAGLATIASLVQRSGGSVQHSGPQLDEILEQLAASIESVATADASAMGECQARHHDTVLLGSALTVRG